MEAWRHDLWMEDMMVVNYWCVVEEGCAESGPELNVFTVKHIACLSPVIRIQEVLPYSQQISRLAT